MSSLSHVAHAPAQSVPRAFFDRDDLRVFELSLSPGSDGVELPVHPRGDALLFVHGGAATAGERGGAPRFIDPAHALFARTGQGIGIHVHAAHTRCTLLVLSDTHAVRAATTVDDADSVCRDVPLSVEALLRLFWLRRAVTRGTSRSAEDILRAARGIRRSAIASMPATPAPSVERGQGRAQRRTMANRARMRLAASVEQPHRLVDVARAVHASPFHLAHVFREEVGHSLHQYLVRLRLIAALDRLSAGTSDLSALALDLGFSNHSHFSEAFRRVFGMVPSEARRRLTLPTFTDDGLAWPDDTAIDTRVRCG